MTWLEDAEDANRILMEGAEVFEQMVEEQGLPGPEDWESATIYADSDGWHIEIEASDGYTYIHDTGYDSDEAPPDYIWDMYDFIEDFVDVEVEYEAVPS